MTDDNCSTPEYSLLDLIAAKRKLVEKHLKRYDVSSSGCWIWNGPTRRGSPNDPEFRYGVASFGYMGKSRKISAHRLSFAFHNGIDPGTMSVCHECDTPQCICPACLFLGTRSDNMDDMVAKGRHATRPVRNILTAEDVRFILTRLDQNTDAELAQFVGYKVMPSAIRDIRSGKAWSHITGIAA